MLGKIKVLLDEALLSLFSLYFKVHWYTWPPWTDPLMFSETFDTFERLRGLGERIKASAPKVKASAYEVFSFSSGYHIFVLP